MKKYTHFFLTGSIVAVLAGILLSCDKRILEPVRVGYTPVSVDDKAGTWKTYILTSPAGVTLAAPTLTTSADYQTELTSLKAKSASLTPEQQEAVVYWGAGAVYRWNEIARELAARYKIPPASNAEGKYPVPDAANPWPIRSSRLPTLPMPFVPFRI